MKAYRTAGLSISRKEHGVVSASFTRLFGGDASKSAHAADSFDPESIPVSRVLKDLKITEYKAKFEAQGLSVGSLLVCGFLSSCHLVW